MVKTVYVMAPDDVMDKGFAARIAAASRYGEVVVGLATDRALSEGGRPVRFDFEGRERAIGAMDGVVRILPQDDLDGFSTLRRLQPDYFFCDLDDDIARNPGRVLALAGEWRGQLIALAPGRNGPEAHQIYDLELGVTPAMRLRQLRRLLDHSNIVRVLEVHSPLCGIIAEGVTAERDGHETGFDAMWSSSLTDSAVRGKPDIELVDHSARLAGLNELFEVTSKPLIYDGDSGGLPEHFGYTVRSLERLGVGAVVIEDKCGLKRNSLLGDVGQSRESIDRFCYKISVGKAAQATRDFAVFARIESFILGAGLKDALDRAAAYVEAGADGIMIHSRSDEPDEVLSFCDRFRKSHGTALMVAPTSYAAVYEKELQARGVNVVIYANHLLRAAYPAMVRAARSILEHGRCREADDFCMSIDEVLNLVSGTSAR